MDADARSLELAMEGLGQPDDRVLGRGVHAEHRPRHVVMPGSDQTI